MGTCPSMWSSGWPIEATNRARSRQTCHLWGSRIVFQPCLLRQAKAAARRMSDDRCEGRKKVVILYGSGAFSYGPSWQAPPVGKQNEPHPPVGFPTEYQISLRNALFVFHVKMGCNYDSLSYFLL